MKKIALVITLILYFGFVQNFAFAEDTYAKKMYLDNMVKTINANWLTPLDAKGKSSVIAFMLDQNGNISNVKMLRSSDDDQFDDSTMSALCKTDTFGPLVDGEDMLYVKAFFSPVFTSVTASQQLPNVQPDNNSNITNVSNSANVPNPANVTNTSNVTNAPNITNAVQSSDFSDYDTTLQNQINANWKPKSAIKRNAVMTLELSKDGSMNSIALVKSSKNGKFDMSVLESILKSVPLASLPSGYNEDSKKIQLNFNYVPAKNIQTASHNIVANSKNIIGYDEYTKQIDEIIADAIGDRRYYRQKDLMLEINIDKIGKIRYVKIVNPSNDKKFDLKMLAMIWNVTFPPIPDNMGIDNITLNYEILTQREQTLHAFIFDYLLCLGTTGIKSFSIID